VIEFARRLWRVSFRETLDRLGGGNGSSALPAKRTTKRSAPAVRSAPHDLLSQVALFYHQTLAASVTATDYLVSRGITNPDVIAALPIGYANGSLLARAPEGSETHAALVALGVITAAGRELMDDELGQRTDALERLDGLRYLFGDSLRGQENCGY